MLSTLLVKSPQSRRSSTLKHLVKEYRVVVDRVKVKEVKIQG